MEKKRILIVDDEAAAARWLKINLEQTNRYVVQTENNATAALAAAERFQPDLILLDVMMPGMDGGDVARRFEASSKLKSVPVVFLTAAVTRAEVSSREGRIGGLPFLAKPVGMPELIGCLEKHLAAA